MNPLYQQIFRAKRYHGARRETRDQDNDDRIRENPFIKIDLNYNFNQENEVTFVDKFHCQINESVISIDSDYLVNFGWAMSNIRPLFENKMARVHPLFMKNSICEAKDEDVEHVNMDETLC